MDLRKLKTLLDLFENSNLMEMEFSEGEEKVRLSKAVPPSATPPPQAGAPAAAPPAGDARYTAEETNSWHVTSPMVGTFYRSSTPDKPPFVRIGQQVATGDTMCIIEAMKLMNEIPAPRDGVVKEILVDNGAAVSYGEKLFVIE